jgi:hypothetical protein
MKGELEDFEQTYKAWMAMDLPGVVDNAYGGIDILGRAPHPYGEPERGPRSSIFP